METSDGKLRMHRHQKNPRRRTANAHNAASAVNAAMQRGPDVGSPATASPAADIAGRIVRREWRAWREGLRLPRSWPWTPTMSVAPTGSASSASGHHTCNRSGSRNRRGDLTRPLMFLRERQRCRHRPAHERSRLAPDHWSGVPRSARGTGRMGNRCCERPVDKGVIPWLTRTPGSSPPGALPQSRSLDDRDGRPRLPAPR